VSLRSISAPYASLPLRRSVLSVGPMQVVKTLPRNSHQTNFSVTDSSVFVSLAQPEEDRKTADRKMKSNEQQRRRDAKGLSLPSSRLRAFVVRSVPFDPVH